MTTQPILDQAARFDRAVPVLPPNERAGAVPLFGYIGEPETAPAGVSAPRTTVQLATDVRVALRAAHDWLLGAERAAQEAVEAVARLEARLQQQDAPPERLLTVCRHVEGWAGGEQPRADRLRGLLADAQGHARAQRELIDGEPAR